MGSALAIEESEELTQPLILFCGLGEGLMHILGEVRLETVGFGHTHEQFEIVHSELLVANLSQMPLLVADLDLQHLLLLWNQVRACLTEIWKQLRLLAVRLSVLF